MSLKFIAESLERAFMEVMAEQGALVEKIAEMVCEWDNKLEPIKTVMSKYGAKFHNPNISGETSKGVIVGGGGEYLFVLCGSLVKAVDPASDEFVLTEKTYTIKDFVRQCDLNVLKDGFESIAKTDTIPALKKNNELADFLKARKSYLLNDV